MGIRNENDCEEIVACNYIPLITRTIDLPADSYGELVKASLVECRQSGHCCCIGRHVDGVLSKAILLESEWQDA